MNLVVRWQAGKEGAMENDDRDALVDPEPFSVLAAAVGIVSGIASTLAAYKAFARESPTENHEKALICSAKRR